MARPHLCVSQASTADSGSLANLWIQSALQQGISQDASCRLANAATVAEAIERPGTTVLLAAQDGQPVGFAVVNVRHQGLLEPSALALDELYVMPEVRRQGVAAQLLTAVARLAESDGQDLVFANVASSDKVSNRYFARLGFTTTTVRRVVPTAVLRRKLSGNESAARDVLVAKRRTLRARARVAAAPAPGPSLLRRSAAG